MNGENNAIVFVKITHSLIWAVMVAAIFYILFSGITGIITALTYYCIGLLVVELVVLLLNNWACPLTTVAKKVKSDWKDGDDIFLPKWIAIHNKEIFGSLLVIGVVLVLLRVLNR